MKSIASSYVKITLKEAKLTRLC